MRKSFGYYFLKYEWWNNIDKPGLYFDYKIKKWVTEDEYLEKYGWKHCYYAYPCHSLKRAKRHLKKHTEIPPGYIFTLVSAYTDQKDIYLKSRGVKNEKQNHLQN